MKKEEIICGIYAHYKTGNLYEVIGDGLHTETAEEMVIYKALYDGDKFGYGQVWIRPKQMFFENVVHDGKTVPRFKLVSCSALLKILAKSTQSMQKGCVKPIKKSFDALRKISKNIFKECPHPNPLPRSFSAIFST